MSLKPVPISEGKGERYAESVREILPLCGVSFGREQTRLSFESLRSWSLLAHMYGKPRHGIIVVIQRLPVLANLVRVERGLVVAILIFISLLLVSVVVVRFVIDISRSSAVAIHCFLILSTPTRQRFPLPHSLEVQRRECSDGSTGVVSGGDSARGPLKVKMKNIKQERLPRYQSPCRF